MDFNGNELLRVLSVMKMHGSQSVWVAGACIAFVA